MSRTHKARIAALGALLVALQLAIAKPTTADTHRIVVYFAAGQQPATPGAASVASLPSSELQSSLTAAGVTQLVPVFPDAQQSDTLLVTEYGNPLLLPDLTRWYVITVDDDVSADSVAAAMVSVPTIISAYPERMLTVSDPDDSLYLAHQYPFTSPPSQGGLDVPGAWQQTTGDDALLIAIVDTGVDRYQPDLNPSPFTRVRTGYSFVYDTPDGSPSSNASDPHKNHGTGVAGLAAAIGGNRIGIAGMLWHATILPARVSDDAGTLWDWAIAQAIVWSSVTQAAPIVNMSFGGAPPSGWEIFWYGHDIVADAVYTAWARNSAVFAAAGNENASHVDYPAIYYGATAVAGSTNTLAGPVHWEDSPTQGSNYGPQVALAAPAQSGYYTTDIGTGYQSFGGTSGATPLCAGAAGLVWARAKAAGVTVSAEDVVSILEQTANNPAGSRNDIFGYGIPDVARAVGVFNTPFMMQSASMNGGTATAIASGLQLMVYNAPHSEQNTAWSGSVAYKVTRHVTFPQGFAASPYAWVRNRGCSGTTVTSGAVNCVPWSRMENITDTGADISTYVYHLGFDPAGRPPLYEWVPDSPTHVLLSYAAIGQPRPVTVSIAGPGLLDHAETGTWTATASGGNGNYTYTWYKRSGANDSWGTPIGQGSTLEYAMALGDVQLQCTAQSNNLTGSTQKCVVWTGSPLAITTSITGPSRVAGGTSGTWSANASGGRCCGAYSYEWRQSLNGGATWGPVLSVGKTAVIPISQSGMVRCVVGGGEGSSTASSAVTATRPGPTIDLHAECDPAVEGSWALSWTAPADDSTLTASGSAAAYDVHSSTTDITESNWATGTSHGGPTPGYPGHQYESWSIPVSGTRHVRLRSRDHAGNWSGLSNELTLEEVADCGGGGYGGGGGGEGGGGLDMGSVPGRLEGGSAGSGENSILDGTSSGSKGFDLLPIDVAMSSHGWYRAHLRESAGHEVKIDAVKLALVDHPSGTEAFATGGNVIVGQRSQASHAVTNEGADVTSLVNGSGGTFSADSGTVITVSTPLDSASTAVIVEAGDGGANSGAVLVEAQSPAGWIVVGSLYPRARPEAMAIQSVPGGEIRLVFYGYTQVTSVARLAQVPSAPDFRWGTLVGAVSSRGGDVMQSVGVEDTLTATLAGPDTLQLAFAAEPAETEMIRSAFLGVTATPLPIISVVQNMQSAERSMPLQFGLRQNSPNPFHVGTSIRFDLPEGKFVHLEVFDAQGRLVRVLVNRFVPAGFQSAFWDNRDEAGIPVQPGVFFYRLRADAFSDRKKMILLP